MKAIRFIALCSYLALTSPMLDGCANSFGPPKEYSTAPIGWVRNPYVRHPDYNRIEKKNDEVRQGFLSVLKYECANIGASDLDVAYGSTEDESITTFTEGKTESREKPTSYETNNSDDRKPPVEARPGWTHSSGSKILEQKSTHDEQSKYDTSRSTQLQTVTTRRRPIESNCEDGAGSAIDGTSFRCWAKRHRYARLCADRITRVAIDQCVAKSGSQNAFTASANTYLGGFLAAASLASDGAAVASPGSNSNINAALATSILNGASNGRNFVPATVSPKVGDMISAEQSYLIVSDIEDDDVKAVKDIIDPKQSGYSDSRVAMKFSRLHDAVYSACPVSAY